MRSIMILVHWCMWNTHAFHVVHFRTLPRRENVRTRSLCEMHLHACVRVTQSFSNFLELSVRWAKRGNWWLNKKRHHALPYGFMCMSAERIVSEHMMSCPQFYVYVFWGAVCLCPVSFNPKLKVHRLAQVSKYQFTAVQVKLIKS